MGPWRSGEAQRPSSRAACSPSRSITVAIMVPGMSLLPLSPDELLSTTRAVRKRLDFDRPVPDDLVRECVALAMQSPSGSNNPSMQFVVVRDPAKKAAIGEIYRQCFAMYKTWDGVYIGSIDKGDAAANAQQARSAESADYLGERMGDAPALVIACNEGGRADGLPGGMSANIFGNILPAMWSFMLAARARGPGHGVDHAAPVPGAGGGRRAGHPVRHRCSRRACRRSRTPGHRLQARRPSDADSIIHWDQW